MTCSVKLAIQVKSTAVPSKKLMPNHGPLDIEAHGLVYLFRLACQCWL